MFVEHKEQGEAVPVKVEKISLSTAMRIGAAIRPQCKQSFFHEGKSCALGAALEGGGYMGAVNKWRAESHTDPYHLIREFFGSVPVLMQIASRNDHGESREKIADWLESQGY